MLAVALFALVISIEPASSSPCDRVVVTAALDPVAHRVEGTASCHLSRDATLRVATYPRLMREPLGVDDVRHTWFYPKGFDPADMELRDGRGTLEGDGPWQALGARRAGETVTLQFTTRVPRRNGVFGERDGTFYMLGGWHPAFADDNASVQATTIEFHITSPSRTAGFVGRTPVGLTSPRLTEGSIDGRFVPWLVAGTTRVLRTDVAVILRPEPAPHGEMPYDLRDMTSGLDRTAEHALSEALSAGASWADTQGLARERLLVVLAPLREHMVERFDGGIAVSDRAFHLLHFQQKLHRMALWRAQLATYALAKARVAERGADGLPPELVADTLAVILRDALARNLYHAVEYAPELLEHIAITPEIDQLIFAPQVVFADAYYEAIDETPRVRNHLDDFDTLLPRGKLVAVKLADRVGDAGALAMAQVYLPSQSSWLEVVRASGGEPVVRGLREWLGPSLPVLDYVLAEVTTTPTETRVRVDAIGPDATKVVEPITVRLRTRDKKKRVLEGMRLGPGELVFPGVSGLKTVEVDPYQRTVQLYSQPGETTRYNDRDPPRWRFLLNDIGGLFAITNSQISANADFALRRLNDLRYAFGFSVAYAPESVGVSASAVYKFGHLVTPLAYSDRLAVAVGYNRLRANFDNAVPGDLVSLSFGYGHDDRLSAYYGFEGQGLSLSGGIAYGHDESGRDYVFGSVGASILHIWRIALGHALVGRLRGDLLIGDAPPQSQLRLGGRYRGGRGYEVNEARGTERLVASGEYRHLLEGDMRSDFLRLFTLTRIEGAFFGDVIALPVDRDGCNRSIFTDVGYGVRFIGDILNVSPAALNFDFGFPLNRCPDESDRVPYTIYASFLQSFSSF